MSAPGLGTRGRILALAGSTAVGKSEIALHLAELAKGEIISVDSMQVYRGMDIGTAKPSPVERARIPHHLVDVVDVVVPFDAAHFVRLAEQAVIEIRSRERLPILCGGTGLYFKAFFEGLGEAPPGTPLIRAELEKLPLPDLLAELAERDPVTYERIDRQNSRRVIRAVEVIRASGKPYSIQKAAWSRRPEQTRDATIIGLERETLDLRNRIDARVDRMFAEGLVEETRSLLRAGLGTNRTALQALGYRQTLEYLEGVRSLADTINLVKVRTRQFAKRQTTWFKRQLPTRWKSISPGDTAETLARSIFDDWAKSA